MLVQQTNAHDRDAEEARKDRTPGVGPNGEVGADYDEGYDEPVRHDPYAERTITLTLNEYEAGLLQVRLTRSFRPRVRPVG